MDRHVISAAIILCLVATSVVSGFAADSVLVRVTCTIPAIPGVNVPMAQQEKADQAQTAFVEPKQELDEGLQADDPQEGSENSNSGEQKEEIETTQEKQTVLVKTFYSR